MHGPSLIAGGRERIVNYILWVSAKLSRYRSSALRMKEERERGKGGFRERRHFIIL